MYYVFLVILEVSGRGEDFGKINILGRIWDEVFLTVV